MKTKRYIAGFMALAFSLSCVLPISSFAATVDATVANNEVQKSYVSGYPDGTIRPEKVVSRAELAAFVLRLEDGQPNTKANTFPDTQEHWASGDIGFVADKHYMGGYPDGQFRADKGLTRAEMASTLVRALNLKESTGKTFSDTSDHWASASIAAVADAGIAVGYPDGSFGPEQLINRAETVAMLNRAYKRSVSKSTLEKYKNLKSFKDLSADHWAFVDLVSASNDLDKNLMKDEEKPKEEKEPIVPGGSSSSSGQQKPKTLEGYANVDSRHYPTVNPFVHPPFYNAVVKVVLNKDGTIQSVEDFGTGSSALSLQNVAMAGTWNSKNKKFWELAAKPNVLDKFKGKKIDQVKAMDFSKGGPDVVSGATASGEALQEAVINAVEGKKGLKFLVLENDAIKAMDAKVEGKNVTFSSNLPKDFAIEWVSLTHGATNTNVIPTEQYQTGADKMSLAFKDAPFPGKYFVNIKDSSHTYRPPNFEAGHGETDASQAVTFVINSTADVQVNQENNGVVVSNNELNNYLQNIGHMIVTEQGVEGAKPREFETLGHHGTVNQAVLLDEQGRINAELKERNNKKVFEPGKTYTVEVASFGYKTVTINYTVPAAEPPAPNEVVKHGEANVSVHGTTYPVRMAVTVDATGKILKVEDNGSEANGFNHSYFSDALRLTTPVMVGKTAKDLPLKKEDVDGISGATLSFNGINNAVINALS